MFSPPPPFTIETRANRDSISWEVLYRGVLVDSGEADASDWHGVDEATKEVIANKLADLEDEEREDEERETRERELHDEAQAERWMKLTDRQRDAEIRDALRISNC